jgi:hypothetical protein
LTWGGTRNYVPTENTLDLKLGDNDVAMHFGFISNNNDKLFYGKSSMFRLPLYDGAVGADLE